MDAHDKAIAAHDLVIASLQAMTITPANQATSGWQRELRTDQPLDHFSGRVTALQSLHKMVAEERRRVIVLSGSICMVSLHTLPIW